MDYIELIERVIDYIESHLEDDINLDTIAMRENFSSYYFHRIFSALVGDSLASYIRKRRLNASIRDIVSSDKSLTDIAMAFNFGSQSSFIRSFKKQYDTTPSSLRKGVTSIKEVSIPDIVKRSLMNFNSDLVTKFKLKTIGPIELFGITTEVDLALGNHKEVIRGKTQAFLDQHKDIEIDEAYRMFFNCAGEGTTFGCFIGFSSDALEDEINTLKYTIPKMLVAEFYYTGSLLEIGDVIAKDMERWSKLTRIELNALGISGIQKINLKDLDDMYTIQIPIQEDKGVDD